MDEIWKVYLVKKWTSVVYNKTKIKRQTIWEVSNFGNVKKNGKLVYPNQKAKYLKIGGFRIHSAVAQLFVPNLENKPCVDHINTNTHDNRACNLRWVTHKENMNNPLSKENISKSIIKKWEELDYREKQHQIQHDSEYNEKRSKQQKEYWASEKALKSKERISVHNTNRHKVYNDETHTKYHYEPNN